MCKVPGCNHPVVGLSHGCDFDGDQHNKHLVEAALMAKPSGPPAGKPPVFTSKVKEPKPQQVKANKPRRTAKEAIRAKKEAAKARKAVKATKALEITRAMRKAVAQ